MGGPVLTGRAKTLTLAAGPGLRCTRSATAAIGASAGSGGLGIRDGSLPPAPCLIHGSRMRG